MGRQSQKTKGLAYQNRRKSLIFEDFMHFGVEKKTRLRGFQPDLEG